MKKTVRVATAHGEINIRPFMSFAGSYGTKKVDLRTSLFFEDSNGSIDILPKCFGYALKLNHNVETLLLSNNVDYADLHYSTCGATTTIYS
jgi:hypothetical protein